MSTTSAIPNTNTSIKVISLFASVAVHALVLASIPALIGETGTGPAESSSTLHVSVISSEPADDVPRDNPDLSNIDQPNESQRVAQQPIPSPEIIKVHASSTKADIVHKQKDVPMPKQSSIKQQASTHKGADVKEKKPMQVATSGRSARLSRDYRSTLQRLVERYKYYPLRARRNGLEGVAKVSFTVSSNGSISNIALASSSGAAVLDKAAIQAIMRIGKAPPLPEGIGRSRWEFKIPLAYNIR